MIAHAAYFSIFESMKVALGADHHDHRPVQAAACGAVATLSHDLIMTPFDVAKQRMQLGYHRTMIECIYKVYAKEGIRSFFVSLPTTLVMNIPYGCIMVAVNESSKKVLNPDGGYSFSTSMISGCIAGAVAAAATNPFDVVKTRLQTQDLAPCEVACTPVSAKKLVTSGQAFKNTLTTYPWEVSLPTVANAVSVSSPTVASTAPYLSSTQGGADIASGTSPRVRYVSALQTFYCILREEGVAGLSRGIVPRICQHAPAVAISWTAYETAKRLLNEIL